MRPKTRVFTNLKGVFIYFFNISKMSFSLSNLASPSCIMTVFRRIVVTVSKILSFSSYFPFLNKFTHPSIISSSIISSLNFFYDEKTLSMLMMLSNEALSLQLCIKPIKSRWMLLLINRSFRPKLSWLINWINFTVDFINWCEASSWEISPELNPNKSYLKIPEIWSLFTNLSLLLAMR